MSALLRTSFVIAKISPIFGVQPPAQPPARPFVCSTTQLLQMVYRGEVKATARQMRAAIECFPFETPKLTTVDPIIDAGLSPVDDWRDWADVNRPGLALTLDKQGQRRSLSMTG